MAEIVFSCPSCGHGYQVDTSLAGRKARCKVCKEVSRIPAPPAPPAPSPSTGDEVELRFPCPRCGHGFTLASGFAGKRARCKKCGEVFKVPGASGGERAQSAPIAFVADDLGAGYSLVETEPQERRSLPQLPLKTHPSPPSDGEEEGYWESDDSPPQPSSRPTLPSTKKAVGSSSLKSRLDSRVKIVALAALVSLLIGVFATLFPRAWEAGRALFLGGSESPNDPAADAARDSDLDVPDIAPDRLELVHQHEQALEEMASAFKEMAQGYASMRKNDHFADAQKEVAQASLKLDQAARKGASLAKLTPGEKLALNHMVNTQLKQVAADAARELNKLKRTPGVQGDFDKLLQAIDQSRRQFDREFGSESPRPSVLLIMRKIDDTTQRETISKKAWALVERGKSGGLGWGNEGEMSRLKVTPVLSARAYADRINFGKVRNIKGRRIEIEVELPTAEEIAQSQPKRSDPQPERRDKPAPSGGFRVITAQESHSCA
jgi:transcription elongation factor Elf1